MLFIIGIVLGFFIGSYLWNQSFKRKVNSIIFYFWAWLNNETPKNKEDKDGKQEEVHPPLVYQ